MGERENELLPLLGEETRDAVDCGETGETHDCGEAPAS